MNDLLKNTFNNEAELYNEVRPRYPEELFDTLEKTCNLSPDARLLEIAPGTGQATKPLAERGYTIIAVEIGNELAKVARRELAQFSTVEIITNSFEDVELPLKSFDLIYCATAFHWIKPEVKFAKTHALLKEDSYLAIIYTHYISDKDHGDFFKAAQNIFEKYDTYNATAAGKSPVLPTDEAKEVPLDSTLFEPVLFKTFPEVLRYSIDDYIKLLCTFSFVIAMDKDTRESFLREIRELSEREYNSTVMIPLSMSLTIGKKIGN